MLSFFFTCYRTVLGRNGSKIFDLLSARAFWIKQQIPLLNFYEACFGWNLPNNFHARAELWSHVTEVVSYDGFLVLFYNICWKFGNCAFGIKLTRKNSTLFLLLSGNEYFTRNNGPIPRTCTSGYKLRCATQRRWLDVLSAKPHLWFHCIMR